MHIAVARHTNRAWYKRHNKPVNRAARRNIARVLAFMEASQNAQERQEALAKRRERDRARRAQKASQALQTAVDVALSG